MRRLLLAGSFALAALASAPAGAVVEDNFLLRTTGDLAAVCAVPQDDPLYVAAIHLCEGYIAGAAHYHRAISSGPGERPIVCPPEPRPTRNEAAQVFVAWAKANPALMGELPVEGLVRAFTAAWPCKR